MKKRILSFVLIISILSSLLGAIPVMATGGEMPVSISSVYCGYADGEVIAEIDFDAVSEAGTVILAVYNGEKFVTAIQGLLSVGELEKSIKIAGADSGYLGYEAKVLCWGKENLSKPIAIPCDTLIVEYERETIRRLRAVSAEIEPCLDKNNKKYRDFTNPERLMLDIIKECIDEAIADYPDEVDADFIKTQYEAQIDEVKAIYDDLQNDGLDGRFKTALANNFTMDNLYWLADTFGIDYQGRV